MVCGDLAILLGFYNAFLSMPKLQGRSVDRVCNHFSVIISSSKTIIQWSSGFLKSENKRMDA